MSILPSVVASAIGIFGFLFLFWRRLKEDYSATLIFSAAFNIVGFLLAGFILFNGISQRIMPTAIFNSRELWFWGAFAGFLVGFRYSLVKFKLKGVETFEASVLGILFWAGIGYVLNFLQARDTYSIWLGVSVFFLIFLFYFLDKRYKSFSWYKSGRIGFSGIFVGGMYFIFRAIFGLFNPDAFSVIGKVDIIPSAVVAFLLFFSLYNLSER